MTRELLIRTDSRTRKQELVVLEEGRIVAHRREDVLGDLIGNVYVGWVTDPMPGYEASFVELGLDRRGFLSGEVLPAGTPVLVQVIANAKGQKGVRLTRSLQLSGRYSVLLPDGAGVGISQKIRDSEERERLRRIGEELLETFEQKDPISYGIILRTQATDTSAKILAQDAEEVFARWQRIQQDFQSYKKKIPRLLYQNGDFLDSLFRLYPAHSFHAITVDDPGFAAFFPEKYGVSAEKVHCFDARSHCYDLFVVKGIDQKLQQLLQRRVWLDSGAYLVLDQTEAMMVIDVNSGKNSRSAHGQDLAWLVNREAAEEIMRQLRLRDLGGMIVCDFIDLKEEGQVEALLEAMRELALLDPARPTVVDMTALGLVEITRRRTQ